MAACSSGAQEQPNYLPGRVTVSFQMSKVHSSLHLEPGVHVRRCKYLIKSVCHWVSLWAHSDPQCVAKTKQGSLCFNLFLNKIAMVANAYRKCMAHWKQLPLLTYATEPCSCYRRRINTVMWLGWGERCLGSVWQGDWKSPPWCWTPDRSPVDHFF